MTSTTRRRGAELEAAILEAAWAQLLDHGQEGVTFEAVAARAGTSRSVLYRRWPDREALLVAALRHNGESLGDELPDTGSLRGDLLAALTDFGSRRHEAITVLVTRFGPAFAAGDSTPAQLREHLVAGRSTRMRRLFDRAVDRGEVDPARVTRRIVDLGADLVRHQMMLTLEPVDAETVREIVDEVVLPLVERARP